MSECNQSTILQYYPRVCVKKIFLKILVRKIVSRQWC